MYTCLFNYLHMQDINMQDNYVYMPNNYVYMKDICLYMQDDYVYMQDDYAYTITCYFLHTSDIFMQRKIYIVMSLHGHRTPECCIIK